MELCPPCTTGSGIRTRQSPILPGKLGYFAATFCSLIVDILLSFCQVTQYFAPFLLQCKVKFGSRVGKLTESGSRVGKMRKNESRVVKTVRK